MKRSESGDRAGHDGEKHSDALYAVPLPEFVGARKRLADELKRAGDKAAAAAVSKLSKPSVAAWLTNQTVRRAPEIVERLLAATDTLAAAQRALGRAGEQQTFQTALAEQRQLVEQLCEVAREIAAEMSPPVGPAVLDKVEKNLRWGGISTDERLAFARGRLTGDVPPPGFGPLVAGGTSQGATNRRTDKDRAAGVARAEATASKTDAASARRLAREQERAAVQGRQSQQRLVASLGAQLRHTRTEVAAARRALEIRTRARSTAQARVAAAEVALREARAAAEAAESSHGGQVEALAVLETEEAELQRRLADVSPHPGG